MRACVCGRASEAAAACAVTDCAPSRPHPVCLSVCATRLPPIHATPRALVRPPACPPQCWNFFTFFSQQLDSTRRDRRRRRGRRLTAQPAQHHRRRRQRRGAPQRNEGNKQGSSAPAAGGSHEQKTHTGVAWRRLRSDGACLASSPSPSAGPSFDPRLGVYSYTSLDRRLGWRQWGSSIRDCAPGREMSLHGRQNGVGDGDRVNLACKQSQL